MPIITNIGEAHLMDLGSREAIAEAKLEIVTGLQEGGVFVYNGDEPLLTNRVPEMNLKEKRLRLVMQEQTIIIQRL